MPSIGDILNWARRSPLRAGGILVIILMLLKLGYDVYDAYRTVWSQITVTAQAPPIATRGGTYAYRARLSPSAASTTEINWLMVHIDYPPIANWQTTGLGWSTWRRTELGQPPSNNQLWEILEASGPGATDIALRYDSVYPPGKSNTLYTLTVHVSFKFEALWTEFDLSTDHEVPVPGPIDEAKVQFSKQDNAQWTYEEMPFDEADWHSGHE